MAQDTELAGHVLGGKYRLVRAVSAGTRRVYEARHERLSGRFAVKLWPATTPWDAFRRGAELAVTLRHPGVMQVLDFNCEPGAPPFLVLEWVDGTRLSEVIAEAGIMPIERVAPLIESAAWALASAHQQGIVHLELRPDELYVVHAAGTMREWVKVAGFGVSAALARAGTAPPSRYRAPEQGAPAGGHGADATDDEGDDPQSDQYALAAIAYEMLAGVPPFDEERSQPEPPPLSDLAPGSTPAVDAAIRQALAPEPEQRFAGVLEFARALRAAVEGASPETVRRSAEAKERRDAEPVSPFFNPLQGASEAMRRVRTTTARLRTLAQTRLKQAPLLPLRSSARIAIAAALLVVAFFGVALLMGRPLRRASVATTSAPPAVAAPSVAVPPPAPPAPATPPTASAVDAARPSEAANEPRLEPKIDPRLAGPAGETAIAVEGAPRTKHARKAARARPGAAVAASPASGGGPCAITVGSRPRADVWIDEHSLGLRTPVVGYHLACGDHKLALKRSDLDIYQMEIITLRAGAPFKKTYPLQ